MIIRIANWFKLAVPEPTEKNFQVQLGVHFEEVAELLENPIFNDCPQAVKALEALQELSRILKTSDTQVVAIPTEQEDRVAFLDAICDQIVTNVGVAVMANTSIVGALGEVSRSNWSKFENGKPVFLPTGKIGKGIHYSPPNLIPFLDSTQSKKALYSKPKPKFFYQ